MKKFLFVAVLMLISTTAFSEDKIYTNEDLKPQPPSYWKTTNRLKSIFNSPDYDPSFTELKKYIENKVAETGDPIYEVYRQPLLAGLTEKEVRNLWQGGKIISGSGGHEENEDGTWRIDVAIINYEIGVSLYFENNKLKGWRRNDHPRVINRKNVEITNYRALKKRMDVPNEDEEVMVSIKACQTLQEALDGKPGSTDAVFSILRHGRSTQEICETVGQGCKSCEEVTQQTVR